jgi:hypothetical protein
MALLLTQQRYNSQMCNLKERDDTESRSKLTVATKELFIYDFMAACMKIPVFGMLHHTES